MKQWKAIIQQSDQVQVKNEGLEKKKKPKPVGKAIDNDLFYNVRYIPLHEILICHCPFLTVPPFN